MSRSSKSIQASFTALLSEQKFFVLPLQTLLYTPSITNSPFLSCSILHILNLLCKEYPELISSKYTNNPNLIFQPPDSSSSNTELLKLLVKDSYILNAKDLSEIFFFFLSDLYKAYTTTHQIQYLHDLIVHFLDVVSLFDSSDLLPFYILLHSAVTLSASYRTRPHVLFNYAKQDSLLISTLLTVMQPSSPSPPPDSFWPSSSPLIQKQKFSSEIQIHSSPHSKPSSPDDHLSKTVRDSHKPPVQPTVNHTVQHSDKIYPHAALILLTLYQHQTELPPSLSYTLHKLRDYTQTLFDDFLNQRLTAFTLSTILEILDVVNSLPKTAGKYFYNPDNSSIPFLLAIPGNTDILVRQLYFIIHYADDIIQHPDTHILVRQVFQYYSQRPDHYPALIQMAQQLIPRTQ